MLPIEGWQQFFWTSYDILLSEFSYRVVDLYSIDTSFINPGYAMINEANAGAACMCANDISNLVVLHTILVDRVRDFSAEMTMTR